MTSPLSQKDVDSLLRSGAPPAAPRERPPEVQRYDFRDPPRIPKDRMGVIEAIHGRLALSLQSLFSSRLRDPADVIVGGVEQASFSEFVLSLASPCATFLFDLGGAAGQAALDLGSDFPSYLVDRLLGGPGDSLPVQRILTPLERLVVRSMTDRCIALYANVWQDYIQFTPECIGFESTPEALQLVERTESVLVTNLEIRSGKFKGTMVFCIPLVALEPFLGQTLSRLSHRRRAEDPRARAVLEQSIRRASVALSVRLPEFQVSMRALSSMEVGQVLLSGHASEVPLELHVGGHRRFRGTPGQIRKTLGVQIVDCLGADPGISVAPPRGRVV